jgi:hypothetical protein
MPIAQALPNTLECPPCKPYRYSIHAGVNHGCIHIRPLGGAPSVGRTDGALLGFLEPRDMLPVEGNLVVLLRWYGDYFALAMMYLVQLRFMQDL